MVNVMDAMAGGPDPGGLEGAKEALSFAEQTIQDFAQKIASERIGGVYIPNPVRFVQGFIDGFRSTGMGLGALAYNIIENPEETKDIIAQDVQALAEHHAEYFGEEGDLVVEGVKVWWEKKKADKFDDFSYDTGVTVGLLGTRILSHGVASVDNLNELQPALGNAERILLVGDMLKDEVMAMVEQTVPDGASFLEKLWAEFSRKMQNCINPTQMDRYVDALKNMFLHKKLPQKHPIKPETLRFLRDELIDSLYVLIQNTEMGPEGVAKFVTVFSVFVQANKENIKKLQAIAVDLGDITVDEGGVKVNVKINEEALPAAKEQVIAYLDAHALSESESSTLLVVKTALKKSMETDTLPPKEVLIRFTELLINHFTQ